MFVSGLLNKSSLNNSMDKFKIPEISKGLNQLLDELYGEIMSPEKIKLKEHTYIGYHGSGQNYGFEVLKVPLNKYKIGFFLTSGKNMAKSFGKIIYKYKITLNSPLIVNAKFRRYNSIFTPDIMKNWATTKTVDIDLIAEFAYKSKKYDGVIIKNVYEGNVTSQDEVTTVYVVFNKNNLKEIDESLEEKLTLPALMGNKASSVKSNFFKTQRYKIMGQETGVSKFIQCKLTKTKAMDFYFLSESTRVYKKGYKRKNADINRGYIIKKDDVLSDNPSELYQITIRVLDFLKWVDVYNTDGKQVTEKDIKDILLVANIEWDSSVPGWYWQGGTYWLQQLDATIYKRFVKRPKRWNAPPPRGHGENSYYLDKISQGIANNIIRYFPAMARATTVELKKEGYLK